MSSSNAGVDRETFGLYSPEHYEPLIGAEAAERIFRKAEQVSNVRLARISSTFYGGGEILTPLTQMTNAIGVSTNWHVIQGTSSFFRCTKKLLSELIGAAAKEAVREKYLMSRLAEEWLDLLVSYERQLPSMIFTC